MTDIEFNQVYFLQPIINGRMHAPKTEFDISRTGEYFRFERLNPPRMVVYVPAAICVLADDRQPEPEVVVAPKKGAAKKTKTPQKEAPKEQPRIYEMPVGIPKAPPVGRFAPMEAFAEAELQQSTVAERRKAMLALSDAK